MSYFYPLIFPWVWYCLPDSRSLIGYNPETSSRVTLASLGIAFQASWTKKSMDKNNKNIFIHWYFVFYLLILKSAKNIHCTDSHTVCTSIPRWNLWFEPEEHQFPPWWKIFLQRGWVSRILFVLLPCHSEFYLFLKATLRQVKILTWQDPGQLFVAQVFKRFKLQ